LILFYLVFQVNYMSLAENWNGKGKNHTELANDRSTPAIVRPDERAPAQTNVRQPRERAPAQSNVRWANDRPSLRSCALEVNKPGRRVDSWFLATSRLQDETNGLD
jgi:hypothetical protein